MQQKCKTQKKHKKNAKKNSKTQELASKKSLKWSHTHCVCFQVFDMCKTFTGEAEWLKRTIIIRRSIICVFFLQWQDDSSVEHLQQPAGPILSCSPRSGFPTGSLEKLLAVASSEAIAMHCQDKRSKHKNVCFAGVWRYTDCGLIVVCSVQYKNMDWTRSKEIYNYRKLPRFSGSTLFGNGIPYVSQVFHRNSFEKCSAKWRLPFEHLEGDVVRLAKNQGSFIEVLVELCPFVFRLSFVKPPRMSVACIGVSEGLT